MSTPTSPRATRLTPDDPFAQPEEPAHLHDVSAGHGRERRARLAFGVRLD